MKKTLLIAVAVILLIFGGVAAYLSLTFKPEKYRPLIEDTLKEAVGRDVTIGGVDFSILGGLAFEIRDLSVSGDTSYPGEAPLRFRKGKLKMRLFPLLVGKVRINQVEVESPSLSLRKYRDGHLSIDDILRRLKSVSPRGSGVEREKEDLDLEIDSIKVGGGSFSYLAELPGKRIEMVTVSPVDVSVRHLGFDRDMKAKISLKMERPVAGLVSLSGEVRVSSFENRAGEAVFHLKGSGLNIPVKIEGSLNLAGDIPEFEGVLFSKGLEVKHLSDLYGMVRGEPFPVRSEGKGTLVLAAAGTPDEFGFEGEMDLAGTTLFFRDQFEKYSGSDMGMVFQGRYLRPAIIISNAEVRLPGILSSINGSYDTRAKIYRFHSSMEAKKLSSLGNYLKKAELYHLSGGLVVSASATWGKVDKRKLALAADLKEINVDLPEGRASLRSLSGHIEMRNKKITLNPMTGLVNGQRVSLTGHLKLYRAPQGVLSLKASYLDLDSLMREGKSERVALGKEESRKMGEFPLDMDKGNVRARVSIDTLKYRGVKANGVKGELHLKRGELIWESFGMGLFNGRISSRGKYALYGDKKSVALQLEGGGVSISDYLENFTSFGGFVDGAASVRLNLNGDATSAGDFRNSLAGEGVLEIKNGKIEGVDLLSDIGRVAGLGGSLPQGSDRNGNKRNVTLFEDIVAPFRVKGGAARVKDFSIMTDSFSLKGTLELSNDNRLNFSGKALLPPGTSRNILGKGNFLRDGEGNVVIPLKIRGPINSPNVSIDAGGLIEEKGKELLDTLQKKLF